MSNQIYNHYEPAKSYERLLFRADKVLQSAELNELQSMTGARLRGIADVLFKEGDIVSGCQCISNDDTGAATLENGTLYVAGSVRGIGPAQLTVPTVGPITVGAYLQTDVVTELEDPDLYNPAAGTRGYGQAGAARERVRLVWGVQGDGTPGSYYPVWNIIDGVVMPKEPPPNIDAVTQAIARYDRDASGGTYVVRGMDVTMGADLPTGQQVYFLREGAARIGGNAVQLSAGRRMVYDTAPDLEWVDSEPHVSATAAAQRVNFDRAPMVGLPQVRVQARKTATIVHGGFSGAADPLPDNAVLLIEQIKQGATVYKQGADYVLTAGQIDWSPSGAEPLPGSSYEVTYQYMLQADPQEVNATGCTVTGALPGTLMLVSYHYALRRYDRLVMDGTGITAWIKGVPAPWNPAPPAVPAGSLLLATVWQSWDASRRVINDSVRVVPMQTLNQFRDWIYGIYADLAEVRLHVDAQGRASGVKKGLFADPMINDSSRDAGVPQTAFIMGGWLQLPMDVTLEQLGTNITEPQTTPYAPTPLISQPARTGAMLVNPYNAFDPLPSKLTLVPEVDYWTEVDTKWANPWVINVHTYEQELMGKSVVTGDMVLAESRAALSTLRPIEVRFTASFPHGDALHKLLFDGLELPVQPLPGGSLVAGGQGLQGRFTIPEGIPAGTKVVSVIGTSGNYADALFTGQGELITQTRQQIIKRYYDPLAQTFALDAAAEVCGVDLWFTAKGPQQVQVQIREVESGVPGRAIVAQAYVAAAAINVGAPTRVTWPPVLLQGGRDYAVVALTNDAETALAVADLGAWDETSGQWVSSQPYQVGVLLSSSNASTWTAHQTRDLTFTLLAAQHTSTERTLELGSVAVQDATDVVVLAGCVTPVAGSGVTFAMRLDDGTVLQAAAGQPVQLPSRYSGQVATSARITGNQGMAAQLLPGMQLLAASLKSSGDYVSPAIKATGGTQLTVILEALLPAGSSLTVQMQKVGASAWTDVPFISSSPQTAGVLELTYNLAGLSADAVRVRVLLTGSHNARPRAANLRAYVI